MWSSIGAFLSGPASNLLSGLIGAIVGVAGLFVIQGLQTRASRQEAQSAARLIYLEIGYNLAALRTMAAATTTFPFLIASGEWERHSGKLATVMPEEEIARVASPYFDSFEDAERALRPALWTGPRLEGLAGAMEVKGDPFAPRSLAMRSQLAMSEIPVEAWSFLAAVLGLIRAAPQIAKGVRSLMRSGND